MVDAEPAPMAGCQRILVVDDDAAMRRMLVDQLEEKGYDAWATSTVAEALGLLETADFQAIVSALNMYPSGGFDLLEKLRERESGIPVVLVSAFASRETERSGTQRGAHAFLSTPFDPEDLVEILRGLMDGATADPGAEA